MKHNSFRITAIVCSLVIIALSQSESAASSSDSDGYWSTLGSKIVDSSGSEVYFSGVNWGGFDSANCIVDGIWGGTGQSIESHMKKIAANGFNAIRLPFSGNCVQNSSRPLTTAIDFRFNPDLVNLTSLEVMQKLVGYAQKAGIRIILDYHRRLSTDANGTSEDGLWFSSDHPEDYWISTWQSLATLFKGDPTVIGADLFNEPHSGPHPGPFWSADDTDPYNWRRAAKRAGDAILSIEPNWLIFVQGMWNDGWWGSNLVLVKSVPLNLSVPNRLVYQVHDYGPLVYQQTWFQDPSFPANLLTYWTNTWGFVHSEGIAPVWIGEFGTLHNMSVSTDPSSPLYINHLELLWFDSFVAYIKDEKYSWTYFTWGPNSRDTGGILKDDWNSTHADKLKALKPIQYPSFRLASNSTTFPPPSLNSPPPMSYVTPPPMLLSPPSSTSPPAVPTAYPPPVNVASPSPLLPSSPTTNYPPVGSLSPPSDRVYAIPPPPQQQRDNPPQQERNSSKKNGALSTLMILLIGASTLIAF